jgi:hypothetical protein
VENPRSVGSVDFLPVWFSFIGRSRPCGATLSHTTRDTTDKARLLAMSEAWSNLPSARTDWPSGWPTVLQNTHSRQMPWNSSGAS